MVRRVWVALVVACVALVGVSVPAQAATATAVSGWSTTATSGAAGYVINDAVSVKTGTGFVARSVSVQRRPSISNTWTTVTTGTTSSAGAYTASYTVPGTGVWYFRLVVKATSTASSATTAARKVTGITGVTTVVSGWSTTATSGAAGYVINDAVSVKTGTGFVARSVSVQRRPSTSNTWTTVTTGATTAAGAYTASYSVPGTGVWYFRLVVPATATAAARTTSSRTVTGITGAATVVSGWSTTAANTAVGTTLTSAVSVKTGTGFVARSVSVQGRPATSSTWTTLTTGTTTAAGAYTASYAAPAVGVWYFRLSVPPTATAAAATTAERMVTAVPAPTITGISPTSGPVAGGTVVTITGTNLTGTSTVSFGGTAGTALKLNSATSVTVTTPPHAAGAASVSVTTPGGASAAAAAGTFTYIAPPVDTTAPGPVTNVTSSVTAASVTLSWANPADADFAGVTIRRAAGPTPPSSPTDGTLVSDTAKAATSFTDTGLAAVTQYSYALFARDAIPNYGSAATRIVTTAPAPDTAPPAPVTNVVPSVTSTSVTLSWANPTDTDFAGVTIRRAAGPTPPLSPTDGTLVTDTAKAATSFTDTGLASGTQYSYTLFAHDGVPNYAVPAIETVTTSAECAPRIDVSGDIAANTTWGPTSCGTVYVIEGSVSVAEGAKLTVAAGAVVKIAPGSSSALSVYGSLLVNGTIDSPVVFTSLRDDSVGGDTNGDGTATTPAATDWSGISGSAQAFKLDHVVVRYGTVAVSAMPDVPLSVTNSVVEHGRGLTLYGGVVEVRGTTLRDNTLGLSVTGSSAITVSGNTVAGTSQEDAISVHQSGTASNVAGSTTVVTGNTVDSVAHGSGLSVWVDPSPYFGAGWVLDLPAPVVTGNSVSNVTAPYGGYNNGVIGASGFAYRVTAYNLLPAQLTGNIGTNNTVNAIQLLGTLKADLMLPTPGLPIIIGSPAGDRISDLVVDTGVTLTLNAGAVLKANPDRRNAYFDYNYPSSLKVNGSLVARGTAASPVVFTSLLDDSVGGDTNGDGAATSPEQAENWGGISGSPQAFGLDHVVVRYATVGVSAMPDVPLSVTNSVVEHGRGLTLYGGQVEVRGTTLRDCTLGLSVTGSSAITVSGNTVAGTSQEDAISVHQSGTASNVAGSTTVVTGNTVDSVAHGSGLSVWVDPSPYFGAGWVLDLPAPVVTGNSVSNVTAPYGGYNNGVIGASGFAYRVTAYNLLPAQLTGNIGTNNTVNAIQLLGTLKADLMLPAPGLPIIIGPPAGDRISDLVVDTGVTLTLNAGAVLKANPDRTNAYFGYNYPSSLKVNGSLVARGTADAPVVFTSLLDDSAGGDTNGDGAATSADTAQNWGGISMQGATASLLGVSIANAATCLGVSGGFVEIRGRIRNCTIGMSSDGTYVDAREVDWGTPAGPQPGMVLGSGVNAIPWVGFVPPTRPAAVSHPPLPPANAANCRPVTVMGLRGSGESFEDGQGFGWDAWDVQWGLAQHLQSELGFSPKTVGINYPAFDLPVLHPEITVDQFLDSVSIGADLLESRIKLELLDCPDTLFVLVGYSQGALAIHRALDMIAETPLADRVVGVGLIADPARMKFGTELLWQGASEPADSSLRNTSGIYTSLIDQYGVSTFLPWQFLNQTISICHRRDLVCSAELGSWFSQHTNYQPPETNAIGTWLGETVVSRLRAP